MPVTNIDPKAFNHLESTLYNAQASHELAELCNNPQTSKEAKELVRAIHETRNKLLALTDKM